MLEPCAANGKYYDLGKGNMVKAPPDLDALAAEVAALRRAKLNGTIEDAVLSTPHQAARATASPTATAETCDISRRAIPSDPITTVFNSRPIFVGHAVLNELGRVNHAEHKLHQKWVID